MDCIQETKDEIKQVMECCKWRVMYFDKQGKSYLGKNIYLTQEQCRYRILEWENEAYRLLINSKTKEIDICLNGVFMFKFSNYSYSIPYPALDTIPAPIRKPSTPD